ncbi:MAG: hypothetical protein KC586_14390 [Myxococcales bacterium]|nr:hypothetical protein [Myxococcales bacterium]
MSSPRLLFLSSYKASHDVMKRVLGGAALTTRRPGPVIGRRVNYDAVVLDLTGPVSDELAAQIRGWAKALVQTGTSLDVLSERDQMPWSSDATELARASMRPVDGTPRIVQMAKPVRGPELRGMLSWCLGRAVTRSTTLDGRTEEMLTCGLRVGERFELTDRELEVVVAAFEHRDREAIAAQMRITKRTVDEYAARLFSRTAMSLDQLVRQAWLDWMDAIGDDEGSGRFGARSRKGSGEVVQGVVDSSSE